MTQTVQAAMNQLLLAITLSLVTTLTLHAQLLGPPTNVKELWEDFDPRREPLDPQIVRQWEKDDVVLRYVTFHVGSFKNSSARLAGFYAFPKSAEKRPALLHIHGGGQRAFLHEVEFYAKHVYPCLSINWGARRGLSFLEQQPEVDPDA